MPRKKNPLAARIEELDECLKEMREAAMRRAGFKLFSVKEVASFHGTIGGKNNEYVDAIRQIFLSPEQFLAEWTQGALEQAAEWDKSDIEKYGKRRQDHAVHDVLRLLQDPTIAQYTQLFLERNFYRQYQARVRAKPEDSLWEIWFGSKNQEYGLFITPRYNDGWENDVSHIRRANFEYWTIEHVLTSGFIIPKKDRVHKIADMDALFDMFHNVFVRSSGSIHGEAFAEAYEAFVRAQDQPEQVPFLIPEFRFEGATGEHKHRLDFTILSASRNLKIGIELSPWSTHGRVRGKKKLVKAGGEAAVEKERIKMWEADTKKRNAYFEKFGITTLTFTNSDFEDISTAFKRLEKYLLPLKKKRAALPDAATAVKSYKFDVKRKIDVT